MNILTAHGKCFKSSGKYSTKDLRCINILRDEADSDGQDERMSPWEIVPIDRSYDIAVEQIDQAGSFP
jgi:hypothetical protein